MTVGQRKLLRVSIFLFEIFLVYDCKLTNSGPIKQEWCMSLVLSRHFQETIAHLNVKFVIDKGIERVRFSVGAWPSIDCFTFEEQTKENKEKILP